MITHPSSGGNGRTEFIRRALDDSSADHAELLAVVRGIESMVESSITAASGDVARQLTKAAGQLAQHAGREETALLYTWIPTEFPALRDDVERHRREHGPLCATLRRLADAAEAASDVSFGTVLGLRIREAVAEIRQHEAAETRLLRDALARSSDQPDAIERTIEVDHRFLRQLLARLEQTRDGTGASRMLGHLREYLRTHFASEERTGGLLDVLAATRGGGELAATIRSAHQNLLERSARLAETVEAVEAPVPAAQMAEIATLVDALRAHEAIEDQALQESLDRDLGGGQ
jgi:hypothetical protein